MGGKDGLPDEWDKTAEMLRKTAQTVLGVTFGKRKGDRDTWWWNEEIHESIKQKKEAKKACDKIRDVAIAKRRAHDNLYARLETKEGEKSCTDWLGRETEQGKMYST